MSTSPRTQAGSCVVIFGATGDLARRKLLPALVNLAGQRALPEHFSVLAVGRTPMSDGAYRENIARCVSEFCPANTDPAAWAWLEPRVFYAFEALDTPGELRIHRQSAGRARRRADASGRPPLHLATPPTPWRTSCCGWAPPVC